MSFETDTALRYRQRAQRIRVLALGSPQRATTNTLAKVAQDYEAMAQVLDRMDERSISTSEQEMQTDAHACGPLARRNGCDTTE
jgi:hypothetical protein